MLRIQTVTHSFVATQDTPPQRQRLSLKGPLRWHHEVEGSGDQVVRVKVEGLGSRTVESSVADALWHYEAGLHPELVRMHPRHRLEGRRAQEVLVRHASRVMCPDLPKFFTDTLSMILRGGILIICHKSNRCKSVHIDISFFGPPAQVWWPRPSVHHLCLGRLQSTKLQQRALLPWLQAESARFPAPCY